MLGTLTSALTATILSFCATAGAQDTRVPAMSSQDLAAWLWPILLRILPGNTYS